MKDLDEKISEFYRENVTPRSIISSLSEEEIDSIEDSEEFKTNLAQFITNLFEH